MLVTPVAKTFLPAKTVPTTPATATPTLSPSWGWLARMATVGCPGLAELDLTATAVSDAVLFVLADGCPDLRSLNIGTEPHAPGTATSTLFTHFVLDGFSFYYYYSALLSQPRMRRVLCATLTRHS